MGIYTSRFRWKTTPHQAKRKTANMYIKTCWSPCFWHSNVRSGSYAVSLYSMALAICIITYLANVMNGGDSSQFYLPLFEADLNTSTQYAGGVMIFYFVLLMIFSILLLVGIRSDIRGLMLPWMLFFGIVIVFQAMYGLWIIFGYYIYLEGLLAALIDFAWMSYNIYCWYVVRNHYRNVKWFQSPDIEVLDEFTK